MNLNKIIILIAAVAAYPAQAIDNRTLTLDIWYKEVKESLENIKYGNKFYKFTNGISHWDVQEQMNYKNNKNKELNFAEAMILIYGSGLKYLGPLKSNNAWNMMISSLINFYIHKFTSNELDCFRLELNQLNSKSQLLIDFDEHRMLYSIKECEAIVNMKKLDQHLRNVEEIYGNFVELTRNNLKEILLTFVLLGHENAFQKHQGTLKFVEELKRKFEIIFQHVLNSVNLRKSKVSSGTGYSYSTSYVIHYYPRHFGYA